MNQSEGRPDRMVAAEDEAVAGAAEDRLHAAAVGLDARRLWIVEAPAVDRAPEIRVQLEVGDAPFATHGAEQVLEVRLHLWMRTIEDVPRTATPAAERDLVRTKRRVVCVLDEPVRMLLEDVRVFLGHERRHPDGRLEAALPNGVDHLAHVSPERGTGLEPVSHCGLVAIIDLDVGEPGNLLRDHVEVIEDVLRGDARTEAVPRAPPGRRGGSLERRMIPRDLFGKALAIHRLDIVAILFELPGLAGLQRQAFSVDDDF